MFPLILICWLWHGGALQAQIGTPITCTPPYIFEVCRVQPNPSTAAVTPSNSGGFYGYYTVSIKSNVVDPVTNALKPLPAQLQINYLAFAGKMNVNGITSKINKPLTDQMNVLNPYSQYLTFGETSGEVTWMFGTVPDCSINGDAILYLASTPFTTTVKLFTLVVNGAPGDVVQFNDLSGTINDCTNLCSGPVTVGTCGGLSPTISFPVIALCTGSAPPVIDCSPFLPLISNELFAKVTLGNLTSTDRIKKIDGVLKITPLINGIINLDFVALQSQNSPIFNFNLIRENSDGSFDYYYSFESVDPNGWSPTLSGSSVDLFTLKFIGVMNFSQGLTLSYSTLSSRIDFGGPSPRFCSAGHIPNNIEVFPGLPSCSNKVGLTASKTIEPNCKSKVSCLIKYLGTGPLNLSYMKIQMDFDLTSGSYIPNILFTGSLPDLNQYGTFTILSNNNWRFTYERNSPFTLVNGALIDFTLTLEQSCINVIFRYAEMREVTSTTSCAIDTKWASPTEFPVCNPTLTSRVRRPVYQSQVPNFWNADYFRLRLTSTTSNNQIEVFGNEGCKNELHICPGSNMTLPFQLIIDNPNSAGEYLEGVTTYDLVLINRHTSSVEFLPYPFSQIAANVNQNLTIAPFDAVQIRKVILGLANNFGPCGLSPCPNWLYFRENYSFPPPVEPILPPDPTTFSGSNIADISTLTNVNFYPFFAVKMGDVNMSGGRCYVRPDAEEVLLQATMPALSKNRDDLIRVPVVSGSNNDLIALQGGIRFDAERFELVALEPNYEQGFEEKYFNIQDADAGEIRFAWDTPDAVTPISTHSTLFTLVFRRKVRANSTEQPEFWLSRQLLEGLAYNETGDEMHLGIQVETTAAATMTQIITPNPANGPVSIFIHSETAGEATVRLQDANGILYLDQQIVLSEGETMVGLPTEDLAPGVYFLTTQNANGLIQSRFVKSGF